MFHSNCIDNWLRRTLECPMCRIEIIKKYKIIKCINGLMKK